LMLVAVCMIATAFAGCGGAGVTSSKDTVSVIDAGEPQTMDPAHNSSVDGSTKILHLFEGLTRVDKDGKTVPGIAEKWDISADGLTYTFHLRNSKWSDGQPLKAQDFQYEWLRVLDQKTASEYAFLLFYIKNAEEFNSGKAKAEDVGIKATNDNTLVVTLKAPCTYFLDLCNQVTYAPVRQDLVEKNGDKWTQDPTTYIGNGAYKLVSWKHNDVIEMTKNDNYWDSKNAAFIKNINFKLVEDQNAALSGFESGEIDGLLNNQVPVTEIKRLMKENQLKLYPSLGIYYFEFSVKNAPFDNVKLRQAMSLAIDRDYLVQNIAGAGQKPANAFVPYGTKGVDPSKDFRSESGAGDFISSKPDIEKAKKLLADAGYPDGKGLPAIEVVYNTNTNHQKISEYLQEQWKKNLGIDVKISNMEFKVLIPKRQKHDFQISRAGWMADYNDPMTFLDIFTQGNGNNDCDFDNPQYEKLIAEARSTGDNKVRMKDFHDAEKILMDEMPVIPLYYYTTYQLENPKLKNMFVSPQGFDYLMYAYLQ
jgi:oligopeptide transport system substrate-binding protein